MEILNRLNYYRHIYNNINIDSKKYRYYYHFSDTFEEDIITIKPRVKHSYSIPFFNQEYNKEYNGKVISLCKYIVNCFPAVLGKINLDSENINIYTTAYPIRAYRTFGGAEDEYYYFKSLKLIKAFSFKSFIENNRVAIEDLNNNFTKLIYQKLLQQQHTYIRRKIINLQQKEDCPKGIKVITQEEEEA